MHVPVEALHVMGLAACVAALVEFICWVAVYRLQSFRSCVSHGSVLQKKVEAMQKTPAAAQDKATSKQLSKLQSQLMPITAKMMQYRFATMMINAVFMGIFLKFLLPYKGVPVARLPLTPPGFIAKLTHMSLPGDDMRDCSGQLIFTMAMLSIRAGVSKVFNVESARALQKIAVSPLEAKLKSM